MVDVREHNPGLAQQKFKDILAGADTSAEPFVEIGLYYLDGNDLKNALDVFQRGVDKFPNEFRLNFLCGNTYYRGGKEKDALPYLEKANDITPDNIDVLSSLGLIYDNLNMDDKCEGIYDEAVKVYPDNALILNNYAYFLSERDKRLKDAEEMSKKSLDKEPANASYLDTYGWILFRMKDYKNAKLYIEKAINLNADATVIQHLGDIYEAMGDIVNALKYWNEALKKDPENKDLIYKIQKYK